MSNSIKFNLNQSEACWQSLIPGKRLPHYHEVYEWWITRTDNNGDTPWKQAYQEVEKAVLAGL